MITKRSGWKTVGLIVFFLVARAIAGVWLELKVADGEGAPLGIVLLAVWLVILGGVLCGMEPARFLVIISLTLGTAFAVAVLMDQPELNYDYEIAKSGLTRKYKMFFILSNMVIVPLLAFSNAVRSYFSKIHGYHRGR